MDNSLSHFHLRFVAELMTDPERNATEAYRRVYTKASKATAGVNSSRLMSDPRIQAEITRREKQLCKDLSLTAEDIFREIFLVATADPRELSEFHVGACRHCHGDGHLYHRTPAEFDRDLQDYHAQRKRLRQDADPLGLEFPVLGGIGFNPYCDPHPECPECFGKGVGYERFNDTRSLSPAAAKLYQGVKRTQNGLEIKVRSQDEAIKLAAQCLGLLKTRTELTGPNGKPLQHHVAVTELPSDPILAAQVYQTVMGAG